MVNSGITLYELTDHLGNVRAVIMKSGTSALSLTAKSDYYPFGMAMPNQNAGSYRYAFQGQEKDPETGMEAFELRLWDGRLGRWLTVDPYREFHSPYVGMGNNPISLTDPDGGSTDCDGCPKNATPGTKYNDVGGYGEVTFNGTDWITSEGAITMSTVNVSRDFGFRDIGMIFYVASGSQKFDEDMKAAMEEGAPIGQAGWQAFVLNKSNELMLGNGSASPYASMRGAARIAIGTRGVDPRTLIRTEVGRGWRVSTRNVAEIMKTAKTKGILEPVDVYVHNGKSYIINGHHRVHSGIRLGQNVPVNYLSSPTNYSSIYELENAAYKVASSPFTVDGRMLNKLIK